VWIKPIPGGDSCGILPVVGISNLSRFRVSNQVSVGVVRSGQPWYQEKQEGSANPALPVRQEPCLVDWVELPNTLPKPSVAGSNPVGRPCVLAFSS